MCLNNTRYVGATTPHGQPPASQAEITNEETGLRPVSGLSFPFLPTRSRASPESSISIYADLKIIYHTSQP